jgi:hypothetical protein
MRSDRDRYRPDVRVAFVTTVDLDAIHDDVDLLIQVDAFDRAGVDLVQAAWEDPMVDWASFDLVVVRSPWNYVERLDEFTRWLSARSSLSTLHNPAGVIGWNIDKHYLLDLADRGVPIVPTRFVDDLAGFDEAIAVVDATEVVVKPSISAGSRLTGRFVRESAEARALAIRILDAGCSVMVQPHASRIDEEGEIGTVVFDGVVSHSFRKEAILERDGHLSGGEYRERITGVDPPSDVHAVVEMARDAVESVAADRGWIEPGSHLLYGRYDVIRADDGSPLLLEAELFEPCFFLPVAPGAADRFVDAIRERFA